MSLFSSFPLFNCIDHLHRCLLCVFLCLYVCLLYLLHAGYTLNLLSFHLHEIGLYDEAMNIWKTLHASDNIVDEGEGHAAEHNEHNKHNVHNEPSAKASSFLGLAFLTQYANAVPQILDRQRLPNDMKHMWDRKQWITDRFEATKDTFNIGAPGAPPSQSMMALIRNEPASHPMSVANIASHTVAVRTLRSHITSDTLSLFASSTSSSTSSSSTSSGASIVDSVRSVAERLVTWTHLNLPTLHHLNTFDMLLPHSDPSHHGVSAIRVPQ